MGTQLSTFFLRQILWFFGGKKGKTLLFFIFVCGETKILKILIIPLFFRLNRILKVDFVFVSVVPCECCGCGSRIIMFYFFFGVDFVPRFHCKVTQSCLTVIVFIKSFYSLAL